MSDRLLNLVFNSASVLVTLVRALLVLILTLAYLGVLFATVVVTIWALLGLVGASSPPGQGLASSDLSGMVVGGATLLLALITGVLVFFTWRTLRQGQQELVTADRALRISLDQAQAAEKQAALAAETLAASWRPMLVDVPRGRYSEPESGEDPSVIRRRNAQDDKGGGPGLLRLPVAVRNVGSGVAVIHKAALAVGTVSMPVDAMSSSFVAPQEYARLTFRAHNREGDEPERAVAEGILNGRPLRVVVEYADQGEERWRTELDLGYQDAGRWVVDRVSVYEAGAGTPFAVTQPRGSGA